MSSAIRKIISHGSIYALGVLLSRLVSFVMLPIYTQYLTPSDYGVLELLIMTVDVVALVVGVGISNGLFKFYYEKDDELYRNTIISTAFWLVICFYGFGATVAFLNANLLSMVLFDGNYLLAIKICFVTMFFQVCISIAMAYLRALQRPYAFILINISRLLFTLSLNIYFIVFKGLGVMGAVYSDLISTFTFAILLAAFVIRKVGLLFKISEAKRLLKFGAPFIITNGGAFILTFSDRYFLRAYADLTVVGIYALAYKFGFMLSFLVTRPFHNAWGAIRFEVINTAEADGVFNRSLELYGFTLLSSFLGLSVFSKDFFHIMSSPSFWSAYELVPMITFAYVLQGLTSFFDFGILYSGKSFYLTKATAIAVVVIISLSFIFIPLWRGKGAAFATLCAFAVRLIIVYMYSQKCFRMNFKLVKVVLMTVCAVAFCLLHLFYQKLFSTSNIIISLTLSTSLFVSALISMNLIGDIGAIARVKAFCQKKYWLGKK